MADDTENEFHEVPTTETAEPKVPHGCPVCDRRVQCAEGCPMVEVVEEIEAEAVAQHEYLSAEKLEVG